MVYLQQSYSELHSARVVLPWLSDGMVPDLFLLKEMDNLCMA